MHNRLPHKFLAECKPQIEQLLLTLKADTIAIDSLKAGKLDPQLKSLRAEISANEKRAVISESAARKFVDDVLNFFAAPKKR